MTNPTTPAESLDDLRDRRAALVRMRDRMEARIVDLHSAIAQAEADEQATSPSWCEVCDEDHGESVGSPAPAAEQATDDRTASEPQTASERAAAIGGLVATLYEIVAERTAQAQREVDRLRQIDAFPNRVRAEHARGTLSLVSQAIVAHDEIDADDVLVEALANGARAALDESERQSVARITDLAGHMSTMIIEVGDALEARAASTEHAYAAGVRECGGIPRWSELPESSRRTVRSLRARREEAARAYDTFLRSAVTHLDGLL